MGSDQKVADGKDGLQKVCTLFVFMLCLAVAVFETQDMEWRSVTHFTAAGSIHPQLLSPLRMAIWRGCCAVTVFVSLMFVYYDRNKLQVTVLLRDGSKRMVTLLGFERFTMFTVWAWILQGVYFSLAAYCSYMYHVQYINEDHSKVDEMLPSPSEQVLCSCWVLFEVCFSISYIVSSIVTFILIPTAKRNHMPTANFFRPMPLLMHNGNVLFMAVELLINNFSFSSWHFPFMIFFGMAYSIFSWCWHYHRGFYYYFFLDYHRPHAVLWYMGLMGTVTIFFFMGLWTSYLFKHVQSNWPSVVSMLLSFLITCLFIAACLHNPQVILIATISCCKLTR